VENHIKVEPPFYVKAIFNMSYIERRLLYIIQ